MGQPGEHLSVGGRGGSAGGRGGSAGGRGGSATGGNENLNPICRLLIIGARSAKIEISLLLYVGLFHRLVTAVGYYGLSLSITSLAGNKYLNLFIGGCVELPAYCAAVFILNRSVIHVCVEQLSTCACKRNSYVSIFVCSDELGLSGTSICTSLVQSVCFIPCIDIIVISNADNQSMFYTFISTGLGEGNPSACTY